MLALSFRRSLRRDIALWIVLESLSITFNLPCVIVSTLDCLVMVIFLRAVDCLILLGSDMHTLSDFHWYLSVFLCMVYTRYALWAFCVRSFCFLSVLRTFIGVINYVRTFLWCLVGWCFVQYSSWLVGPGRQYKRNCFWHSWLRNQYNRMSMAFVGFGCIF